MRSYDTPRGRERSLSSFPRRKSKQEIGVPFACGVLVPLTRREQIWNKWVMIGDADIAAIADGLVRVYGAGEAAQRATERALAELDGGNVGVATTWRRVLNA